MRKRKAVFVCYLFEPPSAVKPPDSEEKNADYKIKTNVEKLVKLGIESQLAALSTWFPINTNSTKQGSACVHAQQ